MKKLIDNRMVRTAFVVVGAGLLGAWVRPMVGAPLRTDGPHLSFAGTLRQNGAPITTPQVVGFTFKKGGAVACNAGDMSVTPDADGQFTAVIPLINCPAGVFDGKAGVFLDIRIGGNLAVADQLVTYAPLAVYAEHAGYPDCPLGYTRDASAPTFVLCRQGADEVVKVGTKSAAFWIDRYEASVWEFADATGKMYGAGVADYPFPENGQLGADNTKGFAVSKVGVSPSTVLTYFQADVACRASGKRLPTSAEWGIAARGTADPGFSAGESGKCLTGGTAGARTTGLGSACVSMWGAEDMIGSAAEFVEEWRAAPSTSTTDPNNGSTLANWGPGYNGDQTTNLVSVARAPTAWTAGIPASVLRGGGNAEGTGAGLFNLNLSMGANGASPSVGFRCIIPR